MTHISIDDHRLAVNDIDRESLTHLSVISVGHDDVEHQCLAGHGSVAAERNPLIALALLYDYIGIYPQVAVSWFGQSESLIASSIGHDRH
jgi:hypothetical protein